MTLRAAVSASSTPAVLAYDLLGGRAGGHMNTRIVAWRVSLLIAVAAATAHGAPTRDDLVVTPAWLLKHVNDAGLVLLHVGEKADYDAGHIPGARYVSTRDLSSAPSASQRLTLEMSPPDVLRSQIEALGISDDSRVVAYYGKDWVSPTTRVLFTLIYAGLERVSLLDGGMAAWTKAGGAVTAAVPPQTTGRLSPLAVKRLIVDADFVASHARAEGFAVVDTRDVAFFDGRQQGGPADRRASGHIPGAHSVPFSAMANDDNTWKSPAELAAIFERAGIRPDDTVVTYCHVGQQATATLFGALMLGHPVLLYDGSFEDWVRRDLPVDNPSKKPE
jgi:thiosulfate/3-mercaptopyruvate sulfurtransferase